jgi:hypothetical protein
VDASYTPCYRWSANRANKKKVNVPSAETRNCCWRLGHTQFRAAFTTANATAFVIFDQACRKGNGNGTGSPTRRGGGHGQEGVRRLRKVESISKPQSVGGARKRHPLASRNRIGTTRLTTLSKGWMKTLPCDCSFELVQAFLLQPRQRTGISGPRSIQSFRLSKISRPVLACLHSGLSGPFPSYGPSFARHAFPSYSPSLVRRAFPSLLPSFGNTKILKRANRKVWRRRKILMEESAKEEKSIFLDISWSSGLLLQVEHLTTRRSKGEAMI